MGVVVSLSYLKYSLSFPFHLFLTSIPFAYPHCFRTSSDFFPTDFTKRQTLAFRRPPTPRNRRIIAIHYPSFAKHATKGAV
jgi:hypothetical protein